MVHQRMLRESPDRREVRPWGRLTTSRLRALRLATLLIVTVTLIGLAPVAAAQQATPAASNSLQRAVNWLTAQQAPDGGFVGFSGVSDAGTTADAVIALAAANQTGASVDLSAAIAFLEQNALVLAQTGPGQAAKLALAMVAAGADPRDINGVDPVSICEAAVRTATGLAGNGAFDTALIVMALQTAGAAVPDSTIEALRASQIGDGSWAFDGSNAEGAGDTNTTALVIQALVASGHAQDIMVLQAISYLREAQLEDGSMPYQPGDGALSDANSTALALQALIAAGQVPASDEWRDLPGALVTFQNPSGAFAYQVAPPDDNLFATLQAIPALAGVALPVIGVAPDEATPVAA